MQLQLLWTLCFLSVVASIKSFVAADIAANNATDVWVGRSPAFFQLRWPNATLLQISLAELSLLAGSKSFFSTTAVTVVSVRNSSLLDSTGNASFEVLFLVGDPIQAFNTTVAPNPLNLTGLATALGMQLQSSVLNATTAPAVTATSNGSSDALWQVVTAFNAANITCQVLNNSEVLSRYKSAPNFPSLRSALTPTSAFLTFSILFRNVNDPANLAQSLVYQVRRGVGEFLGGNFNMSYVISVGPATTATAATLLVNQSFYLVLPPTADTSMFAREYIENRVSYGDLGQLVAGDSANSTRPAMFLDFMFPSTELATMLNSIAIAASRSFAATIFPYVFRSITFSTYPAGNPALPAIASTDQGTWLSATSDDTLNALRRKKQFFRYYPDGYLASLPMDVLYPSTVTMANLTVNGTFTTTVYWSNSLEQDFWLERAESVDKVSWSLFPSTTFFAADATLSSSVPAAPMIKIGNSSTPLWTLQAATPEHLDMALYLRSADDNATQVKVEVAVTLQGVDDAKTVVTSIARSSGDTSTTNNSVNPLDIVVRHQSRVVRNNGTDTPMKLLLLLELGVATAAEKSADGCSHCQQLFDWCTNESGCAALQSCVFSAIQNPIASLVSATSILNKTDDLFSTFNNCLSGSTTTSVDVNSLMLFTSAARCQLQRMCAFPSPSSSIVIPSGTKLVWDSGDGQQRILPSTNTTIFPPSNSSPVNVSMSIGGKPVCYLPIWSNATSSAIETMILQTCTFNKYLGIVKANVTSNATGVAAIDLTYSGLIGPMPVLIPVVNGTQTNWGATISTVLTPSIRFRLESASGPVPYANATDPITIRPCAECKRLTLDVCLRDDKCSAAVNCIVQSYSSTSSTNATVAATTAPSTMLADAVVQLVRGDVSGSQLSFESSVASCSSGFDVNGDSWHKLVNASACYSRSACPLVLAPMLSSSPTTLATTYTTVGIWTISPTEKLQQLVYTGNTSTLSSLQVPFVLKRDNATSTGTSSADAGSLATTLRSLFQYDDIAVSSAGSTTTQDGMTTTFTWTITYRHWLSALPVFIPSSSTEWSLSSDTSIPYDSTFTLVPRNTTA